MAIGAAIVGVAAGIYSSKKKGDAAKRAASDQADSEEQNRKESRYQFEQMKKLSAPYINAGTPALKQMAGYSDIGMQALQAQQNLAGINGYGAQQSAIQNIEQSPLLQAQMKQGEDAMLQNASATGGLRGGNTQAALAQYRPQMLQQAIDQQYAKLGGITNLGAGMTQNLASQGQAAAAGQAAQGMQVAQNVGGSYIRQGDSMAQSALMQGQARGEMAQSVSKGIGSMFGGGF